VAQITIAGKKKFIGSYDDETEAARAYDATVRAHSVDWKDDATVRPLNFPKKHSGSGAALSESKKTKKKKTWKKKRSAPAEHETTDQDSASSDGEKQYNVTCPANVEPGDFIDLPLPTGTVRIKAPKGCVPGKTFLYIHKRTIGSRSSKYFGVRWSSAYQNWRTYFVIKSPGYSERTSVGSFANEVDAARAVDAHIVKFDLDRELNFPLQSEEMILRRLVDSMTVRVARDANRETEELRSALDSMTHCVANTARREARRASKSEATTLHRLVNSMTRRVANSPTPTLCTPLRVKTVIRHLVTSMVRQVERVAKREANATHHQVRVRVRLADTFTTDASSLPPLAARALASMPYKTPLSLSLPSLSLSLSLSRSRSLWHPSFLCLTKSLLRCCTLPPDFVVHSVRKSDHLLRWKCKRLI
jgi:hypothetical protein